MPRTARASVGGICYHAINRGNARAEVFHKEDDYAAFVTLVQEACERLPMRVLAYCLMPNHFHLVLWPHGDGDLGRWMQWLLTSHVRRYGENWLRWVNRPQTPEEEAALRQCIARGNPYGGTLWQRLTARRLGLESSLRPRGRPGSKPEK